LGALANACAGKFCFEARFDNFPADDVHGHFKFIEVGDSLFKVKNLGIPDNPNPDEFGVTGPFISRHDATPLITFAKDDDQSIWHVGCETGGRLLSDPKDPSRLLYASFLGRSYFALFGTPDGPTAQDVHFEKIS
jgi:hypothetical protein